MQILYRYSQKYNQTVPLLSPDKRKNKTTFMVFSLLRKPILDESISLFPCRIMDCCARNLLQGHVKHSQVSQPERSEGKH